MMQDEEKTLRRRIEEAVIRLLKENAALESMTITHAQTDSVKQSPCIVVSATVGNQVIPQSGVHSCQIGITLYTTVKRTSDDELIQWDSAIEEVLFRDSPRLLAAKLSSRADTAHCYAVSDRTSEPAFSDKERSVEYRLDTHFIGRNL
jgi:hypothetical protein